METPFFESSRHFTLFGFLISHGQLLLRASKNGIERKNIDIIFFNTRFIQLPTILRGVKIKAALKEDVCDYHSVGEYLKYEKNKLFELETENEQFFIAASYVRVFENELEFKETSLGYDNKGREKEIAGF